MARVDVKMPDDFFQRMSHLGSNFDFIAETVLQAGGEVVLEKTKSNLSSVIGKDTKYDSRSTRELEESLGLTSVKMDKNGNFNIKVGFSEPRKDGGSNAQLASIIEYGKSGQVAKPFLKPAKSASKKNCIAAMKTTFKRSVENL